MLNEFNFLMRKNLFYFQKISIMQIKEHRDKKLRKKNDTNFVFIWIVHFNTLNELCTCVYLYIFLHFCKLSFSNCHFYLCYQTRTINVQWKCNWWLAIIGGEGRAFVLGEGNCMTLSQGGEGFLEEDDIYPKFEH